MTDLLSAMGEVFTAFLGWVGDVISFAVNTDLMVLFLTLAIVFLVVAFIRTVIRIGR